MHKFKEEDYTWEGVTKLVYKEDGSPFKDVTRQVLFDGAFDLPVQFRYFEVGEGGYSTLEHHEHTHMVMIFRGSGQALLGERVQDVKCGDVLVIPSHTMHQFRANNGEKLGFLCLVNQERDKVKLPTEEELNNMNKVEEIKLFLKSR